MTTNLKNRIQVPGEGGARVVRPNQIAPGGKILRNNEAAGARYPGLCRGFSTAHKCDLGRPRRLERSSAVNLYVNALPWTVEVLRDV